MPVSGILPAHDIEDGTMGRIIQFVSGVGILILIAIVVMAILALTGQFEPSFTNPPS